ncbi:MAG: DUF2203 family protein [Armatimonadetes bacterium]|nr:DUF2203 family protein [Armatimonadota bacterium]
MAEFRQHFTREEANALLPELTELLTRLQELRNHLVMEWRDAFPVFRAAHRNGGGRQAAGFAGDLLRLNEALQRFHHLGVQLKDLENGLVDFPSWREGREVFLCWRLGEPAVEYWHELDAGFAGRKSL